MMLLSSRTFLSELKMIDFIYFNFLFTFILFFLSSILKNLELEFSVTSQSYICHMSHDAVTTMVTQSYGHDRT